MLTHFQSELNLLQVEHHFAQVGEAARVIQDAYKGKQRAPIDVENLSPNKVAKLPVRKTGDDVKKLVPKPKICSFILESDFCKARPTYSSHDTYIDNMTHVRNAIDHRAKHENAVTLREKYEVLEEALSNLHDDKKENIISSLDSESKKLAPSSACPTLEEIKLMKLYFCRRLRVVDHQ